MKPDFGKTADDYARHRHGFPDSLFDRLLARGAFTPGERVVDLGTGTGTLARGFAKRGCRVIGLDVAEPMLAAARELDRAAGVAVEYRVARAEETGLPDACADLVAAGQCWHWFDRPRAAAEVRRLLVAGGRVLLAHFDWLPLAGNLVAATERLIERHNPAWKLGGGLGVHPWGLRDLGEAGFVALESFSYDVDASYTPEGWRGRIRASAGVSGSLAPDAVAAFDREHAALLAERFPGDRLAIPHRVFAVIGQAPRSGAPAPPGAGPVRDPRSNRRGPSPS